MNGQWMANAGREDKYQYNGKELNEDFGLNWYDYGARWLDPAIARWNAVDPSAEKYSSLSPFNYAINNPLIYIDPNGKDAVITVDKENKSIQIDQVFHVSRQNLLNSLKGVPNSEGKQISMSDFIETLKSDFSKQWGSVESAEVEGETFTVNFSVKVEIHDSNEEQNKAVKADETSNKLNLDRSIGSGYWQSDIRTLAINPLTMRDGTFSHEVGHSLGLPGHNDGTGEITSYDSERNVKPREVQSALINAVQLAGRQSNSIVKIHRKGHTTEAWKNYDPDKVIKN